MRRTSLPHTSLLLLGLCLTMQLLLAGTARAQVASKAANPHVLPYEGYLTDDEGTPLADGQYDFTFALYTQPEGGTPIWVEEHRQVTLKNGFVQLELGDGLHPLDLPFDQPYYLSVRVGSDVEMGPRLKLPTAAYSFRAWMADTVPDASITAEKLAPDAVTDEHIQSVSWTKITGVPGDVREGMAEGEAPGKVSGGPPGGVPANVWSLFGNRRTNPEEDFIGTTDAEDLVFRTNNLERLRIRKTGEIDIDSDLNVGNDLFVGNNLDVDGITHLRNTTESTATSNGALIVDGGVGIAKRLNVGGDGLFENNLNVDGALDVDLATTLNSTLDVDGATTLNNTLDVDLATTLNSTLDVDGGTTLNNILDVDGLTTLNNTTQSTATTNGALVVSGGVGVAKTVNIGDDLDVTDDGAFGGSVGIGTSAPTNNLLHVQGTGTLNGNHIAFFENTGGNTGDGIAIKLNRGTPDATNNFLTFYNSGGSAVGAIEGQNATDVLTSPQWIFLTALDGFDLAVAIADEVAALASANGCIGAGAVACPPIVSLNVAALAKLAIQITRVAATQAFLFDNLGVTLKSGGGDYAEYLERLYEEEQITAGDIVGVFGGKITKSTKGAQQLLPVSLAPIVLGNMPVEGEEHRYEKVGFIGQVPVKVLGSVKEGDYIIPSGYEDGTGVAVSPEMMTAAEFTKVIGRAWSASNVEGLKYVNVIVGLNAGDIATLVQEQQEGLSALKAALARSAEDMDALRAEVAEIRKVVADVKRLEEALAALALEGKIKAASNDVVSVRK